MSKTETNVTIDRTGAPTRVLGAVDGSDYSKKAVKVAVTLCKAVNAELIAFHAEELRYQKYERR
jgi:nucleotide-binding universal stress UspA family protein